MAPPKASSKSISIRPTHNVTPDAAERLRSKDRSANGTSARDGRAGRIMRSSRSAGRAGCGPIMEVPKSFLSTLKAGLFSSARARLETALLAGRPSSLRRMSPPHPGHSSGYSSPTRAMSLAFSVERCREIAVCRVSRTSRRWHLRAPLADAGDAAVFAADHGEPLQREGRPHRRRGAAADESGAPKSRNRRTANSVRRQRNSVHPRAARLTWAEASVAVQPRAFRHHRRPLGRSRHPMQTGPHTPTSFAVPRADRRRFPTGGQGGPSGSVVRARRSVAPSGVSASAPRAERWP